MTGRMVNSMDYLFTAGLLFLGAVLFSSVCQAAGVDKASVAVYARANSTSGGQGKDTGINVAKKDVLIVNVDPNDDWSAGPEEPCTRTSNADGLTKCYGAHSMSNLSANFGSLVGRIGDGPFFLIGTSYENEVMVSGRLLLYFWDSDNDNNSGFITANLVVKRRSTITAKLAFLQIEGTGLTPVGPDGIRYGDWFHVEARFDAARDESTVTIDLEWDGGASPLPLQLSRKTGSDRIYLSRPLRMIFDGAPRLIEIPEL